MSKKLYDHIISVNYENIAKKIKKARKKKSAPKVFKEQDMGA